MIGVEIQTDGAPDPALRDRIIELAFRRGLLLLPCGPSTVRFCPPLCLTRRQVEIGLELFDAALPRPTRRRLMARTDVACTRHSEETTDVDSRPTTDRLRPSTGSAGPRPRRCVDDWIDAALAGNAFAANLAERMRDETNTRFADWVDHLVVADQPGLAATASGARLRPAGRRLTPSGTPVYAHAGGMFPQDRGRSGRRARGPRGGDQGRVGRRVLAGARPGAGDPRLSARALSGRAGRRARRRRLAVVERRGYLGFEPFPGELAREGRMTPARRARRPGRARALAGPAAAVRRRRRGVRRDRGDARPRDRAGRLDRPGLPPRLRGRARLLAVAEPRRRRSRRPGRTGSGSGWANHDHHTFRSLAAVLPAPDRRCSRRSGFQLRERFHAGEHAGWGAQILEHPTTGHRHLRRPRPRPRRGRRTTSPTTPCPTCPGRTPSASGSACTASRSSRRGCTTSKPSSTSTASATA